MEVHGIHSLEHEVLFEDSEGEMRVSQNKKLHSSQSMQPYEDSEMEAYHNSSLQQKSISSKVGKSIVNVLVLGKFHYHSKRKLRILEMD